MRTWNPQRVRLVASDLDGTLLHNDGSVSPRTRGVLQRLTEAGLHLVLITARPPRFVRRLAAYAGIHDGLGICCNGALVYDPAQDRIVAHRPIPVTVVKQLVAELRRVLPDVCFAAELGTRYGWEPSYAALAGALIDSAGAQDEILALCVEPVTKLIVRHPYRDAEALLAPVRSVVGEAAHVTHSDAPFVEISAPGIDKAMALAALCAELGVRVDEVVAFGDMPNDLPLLRWAGWSVAMANAHPDVLAEVAEVTVTNQEDGVAVVLERLLEPASTHHRRDSWHSQAE